MKSYEFGTDLNMPKVAVFTGSDLRNYGGGEKDVINWVSRLKDELDITIELQILAFLKRLSFDYNCHYKTILDNGIIIY